MSEIEVDAKKWGNSIGIRIPSEVAEKEGIKPEDRILVDIKKLEKPEESAFGSLTGWSLDAQSVKDELRREHAG